VNFSFFPEKRKSFFLVFRREEVTWGLYILSFFFFFGFALLPPSTPPSRSVKGLQSPWSAWRRRFFKVALSAQNHGRLQTDSSPAGGGIPLFRSSPSLSFERRYVRAAVLFFLSFFFPLQFFFSCWEKPHGFFLTFGKTRLPPFLTPPPPQ